MMKNKKDIDLIKRWAKTGLLSQVKPQNILLVASRLNYAAEKAIENKDQTAIEHEIILMREQGLFES